MFRSTLAAVMGTFVVVTSAIAADAVESTSVVNPKPAIESIGHVSSDSSPDFVASKVRAEKVNASAAEKRPAALMSMYAGLVALQSYDIYSTSAALKNGAREANPVMGGVVGNAPAFVGVKAGMTGLSIFAAERMWRQHHRMQAVLVMAASNGFMAFVAAHNAAVVARAQ